MTPTPAEPSSLEIDPFLPILIEDHCLFLHLTSDFANPTNWVKEIIRGGVQRSKYPPKLRTFALVSFRSAPPVLKVY